MSTSTNPAPALAHFISDVAIDQKIDAIASGFVNVEHNALAEKKRLAVEFETIMGERPADGTEAFRLYAEKFEYCREHWGARWEHAYLARHSAEPSKGARAMAWSRFLSYTTVTPISKAGRPRAEQATEQAAKQATEQAAEPTAEQATEQAAKQAMTAKGAAELLRSAVSALLTKKGKTAKAAEADGDTLIVLATHWDAAIGAARAAAEQAERDAKQAALQALAAEIAADQIAALQAQIEALQRGKGRAKK